MKLMKNKSMNQQIFEILDEMFPGEKYNLVSTGIEYYPPEDKPFLNYLGDFDNCDLNLAFWLADKVGLFDGFGKRIRKLVKGNYQMYINGSSLEGSLAEVICKSVIGIYGGE